MESGERQVAEGELWTLVMQTGTLLWRNYNIFRRKTKIIMFMLLTPIMICFMLNYMSNIVESLKDVSMDKR